MLNLLIAALGGAIGTMLRYGLNNLVYSILNAPLFPFGTFTINILGCFVIGVFAGLVESRALITPEMRIFVQIGILGGFTTFSTFGYETFSLIRDGQFMFGLANILGQVIIGLTAVWVGYYLVQ